MDGLRWFNKTKHNLCALEVKPEGFAVAYRAEGGLSILGSEFYADLGDKKGLAELRKYLGGWVTRNGLKRSWCNWVLHPSHYHLTVINTPDVPRSEYRQAARWQIKGIIDYPLDDVAVEVFYPEILGEVPKKIYVIAARRSFLQEVAGIIQESGLRLMAVDVREFAMRNLVMSQPELPELVGALNISDDSCVVVVIKAGSLSFVRRFPLDLENWHARNLQNLVAELQRSFDYCRSELQQEVPSRLLMVPATEFSRQLVGELQNGLKIEVDVLDLQRLIHPKPQINPATAVQCWSAIGGVLRDAWS